MRDEHLLHLVDAMRKRAEAHPDAPEGIEFYDWWWLPYGSAARLPKPYEPPCMAISGDLPPLCDPSFDIVEIRPTLWITIRGFGDAGVGWDVATRQAAILFHHGYGRLPKREPERPASIDRLAEEGTAFLEAERAEQFRKTVKKMVEQICEKMEDLPWNAQERLREMKRKTEDW